MTPILSVLLVFVLATPGEKVAIERDFDTMDACFAAGVELAKGWSDIESGNGIYFKPFWNCTDLQVALESMDALPSDLLSPLTDTDDP